MTTASYAAPVNEVQRARLHDAQRAVEQAEADERLARRRRDLALLDLYDAGLGATVIAGALNAAPRPWREVHDRTVQRNIDRLRRERGDDVRPGGRGRSRDAFALSERQAARLRDAHQALYLAGQAVEQALASRTATFVALREQGVSALAQADELGVHRSTVQDPITLHRRAQGVPPRNRRRA